MDGPPFTTLLTPYLYIHHSVDNSEHPLAQYHEIQKVLRALVCWFPYMR